MLAYFIVAVLVRLLSTVPLGFALWLGRALGAVSFHVVRVRRDVVLANLEHVFGKEKSEAELRAIAHEAYRQFAMTLVEVLRSSADRGLEGQVEIDLLDRFAELRASNAPLIFIQFHAGNFDLAAYAFAARGFPHHTVMRPVKNARLNDLLVRTRERHGVKVNLKGADSLGEMRSALTRGEWIGLCPDQNAKKRGVTIDWLGKPASIFKGPALLHLETGAQIVAVVDERLAGDPRRHHAHMMFLPPFKATADPEADHRAIMQSIADAIAVHVRRNPEQYFWFHRLWGKDVARGAAGT